MYILQERIRQEGLILSDTVLKVDTFINHQVDTALVVAIGEQLADYFRQEQITKVITIEASGIQFAMATAIALQTPFIYAKKKKSIIQDETAYRAPVYSFTKQENYEVSISRNLLDATDRVLVVDDFLATGAALIGIVDIIAQSGAHLVGVGCAIEKSFQAGRQLLEEKGVRVHSLARIKQMSPGHIEFL
ncbi:xanthine phosphoribosyltransferase [Paenibacillus yanchengensis]|uniref:Xanthine phosphoribosyltransferase n=1 Tax=Paenibacillus yanchengensis TaxID=2035833 RepID=A0ABW4YF55_9BACL